MEPDLSHYKDCCREALEALNQADKNTDEKILGVLFQNMERALHNLKSKHHREREG